MSEEKVLLLSVGGASAPVIYSIKENRPEKVIFFVSSSSRAVVSTEVIPELVKLDCQVPDHEFIITPNEQDVGESVRSLLKNVPKALKKLGLVDTIWPDIVDYTAGTKTMSAAVVWASAKFPCKLSYIGTPNSSGRTKNGLGVVLDGRERRFLIENPWNKIAYFEAESSIFLFNQGQYGTAANMLDSVLEHVDEDKTKRLLKILRDIFNAYYYWDTFDHKKARLLFKSTVPKLEAVIEAEHIFTPYLISVYNCIKDNYEFISSMSPNILSWNIIWDLLANAKRRAVLEHKYEDATARCYAAIEKIAKHELMKTYGINNSDAKPELIPDSLRNEYIKKYMTKTLNKNNSISEAMQFGITASFRILFENSNKYGHKFFELENIKDHLSERNKSILGHGMEPSNEKKFTNLFNDALYILGIEENKLPVFPTFSL